MVRYDGGPDADDFDPLAYHVDEPPPKRQQRQQAAATPVATEKAAGPTPTEKVKDESDAVS